MNLLNVSTASMNANAESIIIASVALGIIIVLSFFFKERLHKFNVKHDVLRSTNSMVEPVSWKDKVGGVYADGVPYYENSVSDEEMEVAKVKAMELDEENQENAEVAVQNDYKKNAA